MVMPSNHLILCHSLLLLPSIFPCVTVFSNELALRIRWPKYWSFSFSISPSNKYSGLTSSRIDWLDLLEVQETLRVLPHYPFPKQLTMLWKFTRPSPGHLWLLIAPSLLKPLSPCFQDTPSPGSSLTTSSHLLCTLVYSCPPTNGDLSSSHCVSLDNHIHFILLTLSSCWQLPKVCV